MCSYHSCKYRNFVKQICIDAKISFIGLATRWLKIALAALPRLRKRIEQAKPVSKKVRKKIVWGILTRESPNKKKMVPENDSPSFSRKRTRFVFIKGIDFQLLLFSKMTFCLDPGVNSVSDLQACKCKSLQSLVQAKIITHSCLCF